jgi:hypothetical protein
MLTKVKTVISFLPARLEHQVLVSLFEGIKYFLGTQSLFSSTFHTPAIPLAPVCRLLFRRCDREKGHLDGRGKYGREKRPIFPNNREEDCLGRARPKMFCSEMMNLGLL